MDRESICAILLECVSETFETMIFTQVNFSSEKFPEENQENELYWADISVLSPAEGDFFLAMGKKMAFGVTRNLYGLMDDDEISETMARDSVAELINTIAGSIMTKILSENEEFQLGLPGINNKQASLSEDITSCGFTTGEDVFFFMIHNRIMNQ